MVNGVRITGEQALRDGDIISFGSTHVRFEAS
jgi:pSer/pThr/pTyr-binding forkhead associated (FHA) protein